MPHTARLPDIVPKLNDVPLRECPLGPPRMNGFDMTTPGETKLERNTPCLVARPCKAPYYCRRPD